MSPDGRDLAQQLQGIFDSSRFPVYLVGGAVRDAALGLAAYDLDFVVAQDAISLAFTVADQLRVAAYVMDRDRDIGRVVVNPQIVLDFARFRGPDLEADLRARDFTINAMAIDVSRTGVLLPGGGLEGSGSLPVSIDPDTILDPCGGLADLQARRLQLTHPRAVEDDPLRALRAIRLCWQLGLTMTPQTESAVKQAAPRLVEMSAERVRDEFLKLLNGPAPHHALRQMDELGLLEIIVPELAALRSVEQTAPHREPALAHTASVLQRLLEVEEALLSDSLKANQTGSSSAQLTAALRPYAAGLREHLARPVNGMLSGRAVLRLAALFHDVGKAPTASVEPDGRVRFLGHDEEGAAIVVKRLRSLPLSNEAVSHVRTIVAAHMRPLHLANAAGDGDNLTRRAVYRFFRATGDAGLDIVLLSLADHLATYDGTGPEASWRALRSVVERLLSHYFERYDETVAPPPIVHGGELMAALDLKPGPQIGRLLQVIEEAQATGEVTNKESALALARGKLEEWKGS